MYDPLPLQVKVPGSRVSDTQLPVLGGGGLGVPLKGTNKSPFNRSFRCLAGQAGMDKSRMSHALPPMGAITRHTAYSGREATL